MRVQIHILYSPMKMVYSPNTLLTLTSSLRLTMLGDLRCPTNHNKEQMHIGCLNLLIEPPSTFSTESEKDLHTKAVDLI